MDEAGEDVPDEDRKSVETLVVEVFRPDAETIDLNIAFACVFSCSFGKCSCTILENLTNVISLAVKIFINSLFIHPNLPNY
jgi:hypothetical protein